MGSDYIIRVIIFKIFFSFILIISPMRAHIAEYVTDSGGTIDNIDLKIAHILCISKYTHICTVLS